MCFRRIAVRGRSNMDSIRVVSVKPIRSTHLGEGPDGLVARIYRRNNRAAETIEVRCGGTRAEFNLDSLSPDSPVRCSAFGEAITLIGGLAPVEYDRRVANLLLAGQGGEVTGACIIIADGIVALLIQTSLMGWCFGSLLPMSEITKVAS